MNEPRKLSRDAVERLAERLRARAHDLSARLLPGGKKSGDLYRAAPRKAGGLGDSLTVYLRTGKWRYFGSDLPASFDGETFGDMLDLIRLTQHTDKAGAQDAALRYLGLAPGDIEFRRTPAEEALARKAASAAEQKQRADTARARKAARDLWLACKPVSLGNAAGQYLAGRIPGFAKLLELGWGLSALRFHPALRHPYAADGKGGVRSFPAMLALCQFGNGQVATVHRYYLVEVAGPLGKKWDVLREKRDGLDGKLAWCAIEGGFVPVWRGSRSDPKTGVVREGWPWSDERAGPKVIVCEGVEDALSLAAVKPDLRYAAALSVPNFMQLQLPAWARQVTWFADDDGSNQQTPPLLERAYTRLEEQGREVAIAHPPAGFKDANEALRGAAT